MKHDWIVASINNPTFDAGDFQHISEMSLDNTQLLSRDQYLRSNYIRENELFKDNNGEFSEEKFDKFYRNAAATFAEFSNENVVDNYEYSMWDTERPKNGKIKSTNFNLGTEQNPDHFKIGISGFNEISKSDKSRREWAQNSKIKDTATGEFLDVSVNDISLFNDPMAYFKSLWDEPLVYATYDEDVTEIDPISGKEIKHKKGEWKVNDEGEYYVETLNGRSLTDKTVVSATDYITSDFSENNNYDFFDSDGLDKSMTGTIAKNLFAALPMIIPYVNTVYSGLLVAREISKSLPMLYGMVNSFSDSQDSQLINQIAAYGQKFSSSTSDYAQSNTFSFENFGNLMSDVALQWGQQKFIANTFSKLTGGVKKPMDIAYAKAQKEYVTQASRGLQNVMNGTLDESKFITGIGTANIQNLKKEMIATGKWANTPFGRSAISKFIPKAQKALEKRMKLGQDLSLVYMSIISNTDVYQSVLEHGGTPIEAAAIALGSTLGMFGVDKYAHLGELFFNNEPAREAIRVAARENGALAMRNAGIKEIINTSTRKGLIGLIQRGINAGKRTINNYRESIYDKSLGFVGKAIGEGFEEVSEELVADFSKSLGELAGKFGIASQTDYGAWENAFDRYTMSFLGGTAGGAMYAGVEAFQNRNNKSNDLQNDITYLLRQGRKKELLTEFKRLHDKGRLGSTELSYNTTTDETGKQVYLTADANNKSQNDYIYDILVKTTNQLDLILNENQLNLSEDELFDKLVQGEYRTEALSDFLKGNSEDVKNISYLTRFQEDFQKLANDIVNKEAEIQDRINKATDEERRNGSLDDIIDKLKKEKEDLIKQRDYLFGEGSLGYVEKMLFAMDTSLSGKFMTMNYNQFVRLNTGKSIKDLTESEKNYWSSEYSKYSANKKSSLDEAFKLFKDMQKKINPEIQKLKDLDIKGSIDQFNEILKLDPYSRILNYNSKLENESDEDYKYRHIKRENETDEQFELRKQNRVNAITEYNNQHIAEWVNELTQHPIDRNTFRSLYAKLGLLRKTIQSQLIKSQIQIPTNIELQQKIWDTIQNIGIEKSNREKLWSALKNVIKQDLDPQIRRSLDNVKYSETWSSIREDAEDNDIIQYNHALTKIDFSHELDRILWNQGLNFNPTSHEENKKIIKEILHPSNGDLGWIDEWNSSVDDAINFYLRLKDDPNLAGTDEATDILDHTDLSISAIIEQESDQFLQEIKDVFKKTLDNEFENNPNFIALSNLENVSFFNNPILPIWKQITQQVRGSNVNLEEFLEEIYQQYAQGETAQDFELSDSQIELLNQFKQDLEMVKAFVHAASMKSEYSNPIGHNKSINEFIQNHKDIFGNVDLLPEIDEQTANFLINEAESYQKEINRWIERSQDNSANKIKQHIDTEIAFSKTRLDFFKVNREAFKLTSETKPHVDLLEGYDENEELENSLYNVIRLDDLLHKGFKNAISNGWTVEEILDQILPIITNFDSLKLQRLSKLDPTISINTLTDYDKFTMLVSNFAIDDVDFYTNVLKFIEENKDLAPLSIQEYASRITKAMVNDPKTVNSAIEYLGKKFNLPVLKNVTIITGVAGAGKTKATARLATTMDGTDTWLCGPTESQINSLVSTLPKGTAVQKIELLNKILGPTKTVEFLKDPQNEQHEYYNIIDGQDGDPTVVLKDNVTVATLSNPPKFLIIDEATHFSTAELLLISKFAVQNNIQVILLGDESQNGFVQQDVMANLNMETVLAWRAPKMFISLRENNIQKTKNLNPLIKLIDQLEATTSDQERGEVLNKMLNQDLKEFALHYYNSDKLFGELITNEVSQELIDKLDGEIGFVGTENNLYKRLKDAGKNVVLVNPLEVQGREFKYVIIDKDWNLPQSDTVRAAAINLKHYLKDLYTMISRSQEGSIIIDNGLSKIIKNTKDEITGYIDSIKNSVAKFREIRTDQIKQALEQFASQPNPQPQPQPSPQSNPQPQPNPQPQSNPQSNPNPQPNPQSQPSPQPSPQSQPQSGPEVSNNQQSGSNQIEEPEISGNIIQGTDITINDIQEETSNIKEARESREVEVHEAEVQNNVITTNMTTPIRVYGNMSFSGLNITHGENQAWTNPSDLFTDLGIFLRSGEEVKTGTQKHELVAQLLKLKCIFLYNIKNENIITNDIKKHFRLDSINNAEFYIRVDTKQPENDLIGLENGLDSNKRDINNRVISIVAKIKNNEGKICTLTLGTIANPETWAANEENIRRSIEERIANNDPQKEELQKYLDNLSDNIKIYKTKVKEIIRKSDSEYAGQVIAPNVKIDSYNGQNVQEIYIETWVLNNPLKLDKINVVKFTRDSNGKILAYDKNNNSIEIKQLPFATGHEYKLQHKPSFSGFTNLYPTGGKTRLEEINPYAQDESGNNLYMRPYDFITPYSVKSEIVAITQADVDSGINPKLLGKPVMFVSNNLFLLPSQLQEIYLEQKSNPNNNMPMVRMIPLDTMGVSFESLYQKKYQSIYTISHGDVKFSTPFDLEPMGVRMYKGIWNFRANLKIFLEKYNEWKNNLNLSDYEIEELCKLDRKWYVKIRENLNVNYLDEKTYRESEEIPENIKKKLEIIWKFNDSLSNGCRQFRLGYEKSNGAYIRKLTNLTDDGFYKDPQNALGIYINPNMAQQFNNMLDNLFTNIIEKIIPAPEGYSVTKHINDNLIKGWFKHLVTKGEIITRLNPEDETSPITLKIDAKTSQFAKLATALIQIGKFSTIRNLDIESFDTYLINNPEDNRYRIIYKDATTNEDVELDWISVNPDNVVETSNDEYSEFIEENADPGIRPFYKGKNGEKSFGIIDKRLDNLFSLMFHGLTSSRHQNDFNKGDIRATDAPFKFGFFADVIIEGKRKNSSGELIERQFVPVLTNKKLFASDVYPSLPNFALNLDFDDTVDSTNEQKLQESEANDIKQQQKEQFDQLVSTIPESVKVFNSEDIFKDAKNDLSVAINKLTKHVQSKIKLTVNKIFKTNRNAPKPSNFSELIIDVKFNKDENRFEFTYINQLPEFANKVINKISKKNNTLQITLNNGDQYNMSMNDDSSYNINKVLVNNNQVLDNQIDNQQLESNVTASLVNDNKPTQLEFGEQVIEQINEIQNINFEESQTVGKQLDEIDVDMIKGSIASLNNIIAKHGLKSNAQVNDSISRTKIVNDLVGILNNMLEVVEEESEADKIITKVSENLMNLAQPKCQ